MVFFKLPPHLHPTPGLVLTSLHLASTVGLVLKYHELAFPYLAVSQKLNDGR